MLAAGKDAPEAVVLVYPNNVEEAIGKLVAKAMLSVPIVKGVLLMIRLNGCPIFVDPLLGMIMRSQFAAIT